MNSLADDSNHKHWCACVDSSVASDPLELGCTHFEFVTELGNVSSILPSFEWINHVVSAANRATLGGFTLTLTSSVQATDHESTWDHPRVLELCGQLQDIILETNTARLTISMPNHQPFGVEFWGMIFKRSFDRLDRSRLEIRSFDCAQSIQEIVGYVTDSILSCAKGT